MTVQKQNKLTTYGAIVGSVLVLGAGFGFGYDTLIKPKVQAQIDTCIREAKEQNRRDITEIKDAVKDLARVQIEMQKSISRIEGKIEALK